WYAGIGTVGAGTGSVAGCRLASNDPGAASGSATLVPQFPQKTSSAVCGDPQWGQNPASPMWSPPSVRRASVLVAGRAKQGVGPRPRPRWNGPIVPLGDHARGTRR